MDRRQRRTRDAIFKAFIHLLSQKDFSHITVGEIINAADIGRATFYAHFETKDFLLKEFCQELFCHIFDAMEQIPTDHRHIFHCNAPDSVFLHLLQHIRNNDNSLLDLLSRQRNGLFMEYFRCNLQRLVTQQLPLFAHRKDSKIPDSFWLNHITSTFIETVWWWMDNGLQQSPEQILEYFLLSV